MASRSSLLLHHLFLFVFFALCSYSLNASAYHLSIGTHPTRLRVGPWHVAKNSPNFETSGGVVCEIIHIEGYSMCANLKDYARVLKVKVVVEPNPDVLSRHVTICLHKNPYLDLGICSPDKWEKVITDFWFHSMLPSEDKYLDICFSGTTLGMFEVSTEEGLSVYNVAFLAVIFLLVSFVASAMINSLDFYYGGAIGVGFLLLLMAGVGTFMIGECMFRAWLGIGRSLVGEYGSVDDSGTSCFIKQFIFILSAILIIKGTSHIWLALPPLFSSILFAPIVRRMLKSRFFFILYRISCKRDRRMSKCLIYDASTPPSYQRMNENQSKRSTSSKCGSNHLSSFEWMNENQSMRSPPSHCGSKHIWTNKPDTTVAGNYRRFEHDSFYSTFHKIPGRRNYSDEDWKELTKYSTKNALEQLMASSAFVEWAVSNMEKITFLQDHGQF